MATNLDPAMFATTRRAGWSSDDTLDHIWCDCTGPDVALCGRDLSDVPEADELSDLCVVCVELDASHCTT